LSRAGRIFLVSLVVLAGCDAAKEPYSRAAAAEAEGKLADAQALYAEVCTKAARSPLCALAQKRIEALTVKEAQQALGSGEWAKAKALFTKVQAAESTSVKIAAGTGLEDEELKAGLAWEDALALGRGAVARGAMEDLAKAHTAGALKAREWLAKNGPALLLEDIKAACNEGGKGSCVELGEKMAEVYPTSPEAAEAQKLVDAEYERIRKKLREVEALLVQRLEVYFKKTKFDLCVAEQVFSPESSCRTALELPEEGELFSTGPIEKMFDQKLDELGDPGYVTRFRERYRHIERTGEHDFTTWDKRGDKKN
jgi:hypothetical protein